MSYRDAATNANSSPRDLRPSLDQQVPQDRPMTPRLIFAVTTDRERSFLRQRRQRVEQPRLLRLRHLRPIASCEGFPLRIRLRSQRRLHERFARREIRQPHVEEVALRPVPFRHAAWRTTHGANAHAFAGCARAAETNDGNRHVNTAWSRLTDGIDVTYGQRAYRPTHAPEQLPCQPLKQRKRPPSEHCTAVRARS